MFSHRARRKDDRGSRTFLQVLRTDLRNYDRCSKADLSSSVDFFECNFLDGHGSQRVSGCKDDVVDLANFLEELLDILFQARFGEVATEASDLVAGVRGLQFLNCGVNAGD